MPNVYEYVNKLKQMKDIAISCFDGHATHGQVKLFVDTLKSMKEANELGMLTGQAQEAYTDLIETLKAQQDETDIQREIKERAMNAFTNMAGNLNSDAAFDAGNYSEMYELVSNKERIRKERTEYEQKRWAEDQFNNEMRNAIKAHDPKALDQALREREQYGFTEIRNQFKKDGYEQGKVFKSCTEVLQYSIENKKKENKTEEEQAKYDRIEGLRKSHLFIPYMKVVYDISKDKEKILYNDESLQKAKDHSLQTSEKKIDTTDIVKHRDEHAADIKEKFKQFDEISARLNSLYAGKKTDKFKEMVHQMDLFNLKKLDNEMYKENCLNDGMMDRYQKAMKDLTEKVDVYIQHKQRQIFPGKLGKDRLAAAKEMKALLTGMQTSMQKFKKYSSQHPQERYTLMSQMMQERKAKELEAAAKEQKTIENAVAAPGKPVQAPEKQDANQNLKSEKRNSVAAAPTQTRRSRSNSMVQKSPVIKKGAFTEEDRKLLAQISSQTKEQLLAPYSIMFSIAKGELREKLEKDMLNSINRKRELLTFKQLRDETSLKRDEGNKTKRLKEAEDVKMSRKLKLDPPDMKPAMKM